LEKKVSGTGKIAELGITAKIFVLYAKSFFLSPKFGNRIFFCKETPWREAMAATRTPEGARHALPDGRPGDAALGTASAAA
jgi:hypothetical protein